MQAMQESGLSPLEVLLTTTRNAGQAFQLCNGIKSTTTTDNSNSNSNRNDDNNNSTHSNSTVRKNIPPLGMIQKGYLGDMIILEVILLPTIR